MTEQSQTLLATEDLEKAISRQGFKHPVLDLLEVHGSDLVNFSKTYKGLPNPPAQQDYMRGNLGFFADAVEEVKSFASGPLDIVAVWSKIDDLQLSARYNLIRAVAFAYMTHSLPTRQGSNRYFLESGKFPKRLFTSANDIKISEMRLTEVQDSLKEIDFYCYGVRKTFLELLAGMNLPGGSELLSRVVQRTKSSPLIIRLTELHENCGGGIAPLRPYLNTFEF